MSLAKTIITAVKEFVGFVVGDKPKLEQPLEELETEKAQQAARDRRRDRRNHGGPRIP